MAVLCAGFFTAAADAQVIAASDAIDHGDTTRESAERYALGPVVLFCGYLAAAAITVLILRRRRARLVQPGLVPPSRMVPFLTIGFFGLLVAQMLGTVIAASFVGATDGAIDLRPKAIVMLGGYAMQLPVAAALGLALMRPAAMRRIPRLAFEGTIGIVLIWPFVQIASMSAGAVQRLLTQAAPPELGHETLNQLASAPGDPWSIAIVLCVVVLAPIVEEVAYRGALQGALRGVGFPVRIAIALTSAMFVIMHLPALPKGAVASAVSGLFLLAVGLGMLRERTQALLPCIVAHALFNALNLILTWFIATLPHL